MICEPHRSRTWRRSGSRRAPETRASSPISQRARFGVQRTVADPRIGHDLHPDRLPDAGGPRIPDRMRLQLPVLLAARLGQILRVVFDPDDDLEGLGAECARREVDRERRVAADVMADREAAGPHRRFVIDRAEMQQEPFAFAEPRHRNAAPIPAGAKKRCHPDPAGRGLGGERDANRPVPLNMGRQPPRSGRVEGEIPGPVEGHPSITAQLRTRIPAAEVIRR